MATVFHDTTADHKWSTAANWSDGVPDAADDVTVDTDVTSLIIDATASCLGLNLTGTAGITISGSANLTLRGDFVLDANCTWTGTGTIFIATNACTFTTANKDLSSVAYMYMYSSADVTLNGNLNLGAKGLFVYGTGTSLITSNYQIDCGSIGDGGSSQAVTLNLGTSTINCSGISYPSANLTVTSTTHTINITQDSPATLNFAGKAWGIVNFHVDPSTTRTYAISPGSGASFVQLNITHDGDNRSTSITFNNDFSIGNSSTWIGGGIGQDDPTYRPVIGSDTILTTRTITVTAASKTLTLTDVDFRDIKIADTNSPTVTLTRVGDTGGNTTSTAGGYIQNVSDPKTVYLDAGTNSTTYFTNYWSASSGGGSPTLNNFPLPQDTAVIDNLSWDTTGRNMSIAYGRVGNIDASGLTESDTFTIGSSTFYGDLDLSGSGFATVAFSSSGVVATFNARVSGTSNIKTVDADWGAGNITINSYGGTVLLGTAIKHVGTFTLTQGTFDLGGQVLTTNSFASSNENTRVLQDTPTGGKIIVKALTGTIFDMSTNTGLTVDDAPDIDIGTSALTLTADVTFAGGGKTFGDFKVTKHAGDFDCILTGANTFGTFTCETPDAGAGGAYKYSDVQFTAGAGSVTTVTSFVATGDSTNKININSVTTALHYLKDTTGTNTVSYCVIDYSEPYGTADGGGALWDASDGTNTDSGHNTVYDAGTNEGWKWPAGGALTISVSDTTTITDGTTQGLYPEQISLSDTSSITDAITLYETSYKISISDTTAITDTPTLSLGIPGNLSISLGDTTTITDSETISLGSVGNLTISVSDTTNITDTPTLFIPTYKIQNQDTTAITDNQILSILTPGAINVLDTTTVTDSVSLYETSYKLSVSDTTAITDLETLEVSTAGDLSISVSDTTVVSDNIIISGEEEPEKRRGGILQLKLPILKRWNGSQWVHAPIKMWTTKWIIVKFKVYLNKWNKVE
jgi:hypothetical protein